jgi:hypothetical protein
VRKEETPAIADPIMEVDFSRCRFNAKVWGDIANT